MEAQLRKEATPDFSPYRPGLGGELQHRCSEGSSAGQGSVPKMGEWVRSLPFLPLLPWLQVPPPCATCSPHRGAFLSAAAPRAQETGLP